MDVDPWQEIRGHLSPDTASLFDLSPWAQTSANIYSMANFVPLIEPLLATLRPKHICEIGTEKGLNTRFLLNFCESFGSRLSLVDPTLEDDELSGHHAVVQYAQTSAEFLEKENDVDLYLIDGDHNFETVSLELKLIAESVDADRRMTVLLHDTSWPCARRDLYYDPVRMTSPLEYSTDRGISLFSSNLDKEPWGRKEPVSIALSEGGPRNGVLTAIDDFFENPFASGWRRTSIPSCYGLTIMWFDKGFDAAEREAFNSICGLFDRIRPFLATLELNRILLLTQLQKSGDVWERQKETIGEQGRRLESQRQERDRQKQELEGQRRELDHRGAVVDALNQRLERLRWVEAPQNFLRNLSSSVTKAVRRGET